jgi:hypothetical protein
MRGDGKVYLPEVAPLIHMETITLSVTRDDEGSDSLHSVPTDSFYMIPDPGTTALASLHKATSNATKSTRDLIFFIALIHLCLLILIFCRLLCVVCV